MYVNSKIFITLFLAVFVTTIGAGIVAPLLPVYAHELGAGAFQIGLILGAFSLTRSIFVPFFGKLSDQKGRKPFLTTGLFICFFIALLYTASKSIESLILIRLGQGFASAMILPVAQAYIGTITPPRKEGQLMGLFNISIYGGLSIGPLLGGIVKDWFNIQVSFLSMAALTLIGFFLCLFLLPPEKGKRKRIPDGSIKSISYLELLKIPKVFSLFIFLTSFIACVGIVWTFLPLLAGTKLNFSSSAIGILVTINVFISALFQLPMGYLADRFNKKKLVAAGGVIAAISILFINATPSFGGIALANGFLGLAGGISFPSIMALGVIEGRKAEAMGSLMGFLALAHSIGMLAGPLLAGIFIDLFSFDATLILGSVIVSLGTLTFLRNY